MNRSSRALLRVATSPRLVKNAVTTALRTSMGQQSFKNQDFQNLKMYRNVTSAQSSSLKSQISELFFSTHLKYASRLNNSWGLRPQSPT